MAKVLAAYGVKEMSGIGGVAFRGEGERASSDSRDGWARKKRHVAFWVGPANEGLHGCCFISSAEVVMRAHAYLGCHGTLWFCTTVFACVCKVGSPCAVARLLSFGARSWGAQKK